jgi:hypothetical protein
MATKPLEPNQIAFIDGTVITAQPLKISLLRPFMKRFQELPMATDDNDKSIDILLDCVAIAMKQYKPELADDRESLENNLDLPTVYKIVDIASGVPIADPTAIVNALGK